MDAGFDTHFRLKAGGIEATEGADPFRSKLEPLAKICGRAGFSGFRAEITEAALPANTIFQVESVVAEKKGLCAYMATSLFDLPEGVQKALFAIHVAVREALFTCPEAMKGARLWQNPWKHNFGNEAFFQRVLDLVLEWGVTPKEVAEGIGEMEKNLQFACDRLLVQGEFQRSDRRGIKEVLRYIHPWLDAVSHLHAELERRGEVVGKVQPVVLGAIGELIPLIDDGEATVFMRLIPKGEGVETIWMVVDKKAHALMETRRKELPRNCFRHFRFSKSVDRSVAPTRVRSAKALD